MCAKNYSDNFYTSNGENILASSAPFYLIQNSTSNFSYNGILGLNPSYDSTKSVPLPLVMSQQGQIQAGQVGISIYPDGSKPSTMTIGSYDSTAFRNSSDTVATLPWISIDSKATPYNGWSTNLTGFFYGGHYLDDGKPNLALYDPFYPGLVIPTTEWGNL